jgi:hypothetical protein
MSEETRERLEAEMHAQQIASTVRGRIAAGERPLDSSLAEVVRTLPPSFALPILSAQTEPRVFEEWCRAWMDEAPPQPDELPGTSETLAIVREHVERELLLEAGG